MADDDPLTRIKRSAEALNRRGGGLRTTDLPLDVRRGIGFWRASQTHRVFAVSKSRAARASAWVACRMYGESIGVREGPEYTGWRSNHTANFWVWWAADLGDLQALAAVSEEPELAYDVNMEIEAMWGSSSQSKMPVDKSLAT